jgi:pimeloyl-ACP methyl ester carboxylesterase
MAPSPVRTPGAYADVGGLAMYYEVHGSGDPLLMLHGGLSNLGEFRRLLPALAGRHRVIAADRQGHGRTADVDRPFAIEGMADDTAALLGHLGVQQADVFGYSTGGSVALELAIRHPGLVRKLALSSAVYAMDGYQPEVTEGLRRLTPDALPPPVREAYERVAPRPEGWPGLVAKSSELARTWRGADPAAVRAIVADRDVVRAEHAQELARLLGAELVVLPDSDHYSYLADPPELLVSKLTAFLDAPA